jgi:predicted transcriptional regulator
MLEQLFGSKTRVRLLRLFLANPDNFYYIRELTRKIGVQINAIRRELANLQTIGLIKVYQFKKDEAQDKLKIYFRVETNFILYRELRALFLKAQLLMERKLLTEIERIGQISYLVLTGTFLGFNDSPTDLLIVGRINRGKLANLIKKFEKDMDCTINYTIMSREEFNYRKDITDKFLYQILENKKIVVIDKIKQEINLDKE